MKLLKKNIDARTQSGSVTLLPEEPEDMWHAFNLIRPADLVRAAAIRRVIHQSTAGTSASHRVHTTLTVRVLSTDFDGQASALNVAGKIAEQNAYAPLGSHHTLDLEVQRQFVLTKGDGGWDSVALDMLREATEEENRASMWAVMMEEGLANVCYVTEHRTVLKQQVTANIPKKRAGAADYEKGIAKFHATLLTSLLHTLSLTDPATVPKPLLIASPGFYAQNFFEHIKSIAPTLPHKPLHALLPLITISHAPTSAPSALPSLLSSSPALAARLADTRFVRESDALAKLFALLREDDARAWYGEKEVRKAVDGGGVGRGGGVLFLMGKLFRAVETAERKKWVGLVEEVRSKWGGEVHILSEEHESGKRLEVLGGVAALLTFPMPGLDEEDVEV